jgi:hypothetical protein
MSNFTISYIYADLELDILSMQARERTDLFNLLIFFPFVRWDFGYCGHYWLGEIDGMNIGRGNRSTRKKPAPAPLCPLQIPHDQTRV